MLPKIYTSADTAKEFNTLKRARLGFVNQVTLRENPTIALVYEKGMDFCVSVNTKNQVVTKTFPNFKLVQNYLKTVF